MTDKRTRADLIAEINDLKNRLAYFESQYQLMSDTTTLSADETRFSQLLETLPITIFIYQDEDIVYLNPAGRNLGGHDLSMIIREGFWHVIHPDSLDNLRDAFRQFNHAEKSISHLEVKAYDVHQQIRILDVQMVSISYNQHPALLGAVLDVTARIQSHEQQVALEAEKHRVKMLTDFVRDVSHDFRTPLSTINTGIYLLGRIDDPIKRQQQLDTMREQVRHLDKLVDGLLTMSRLDSGLSTPFKLFDLNLSIIEAIQSVSPHIKEKKQHIHTDLQDDLPLIEGDMQDIYRAIREVILNAVQYTPASGDIFIASRQHDNQAHITIQDTGYGISKDDLPHIFDRFFRADQARTVAGVGLGLSIARKVIDHHRGQIEVRSVLQHGSTFIIHLPIHHNQEDT